MALYKYLNIILQFFKTKLVVEDNNSSIIEEIYIIRLKKIES